VQLRLRGKITLKAVELIEALGCTATGWRISCSWNAMLRHLVVPFQRSEGSYCLHFQGIPRRNFLSCFSKIYSGPGGNYSVFDVLTSPYVIKVFKQNIIGGACGTHGRKHKCLQVFNRKTGIKEIYIEFRGVVERG